MPPLTDPPVDSIYINSTGDSKNTYDMLIFGTYAFQHVDIRGNNVFFMVNKKGIHCYVYKAQNGVWYVSISIFIHIVNQKVYSLQTKHEMYLNLYYRAECFSYCQVSDTLYDTTGWIKNEDGNDVSSPEMCPNMWKYVEYPDWKVDKLLRVELGNVVLKFPLFIQLIRFRLDQCLCMLYFCFQ